MLTGNASSPMRKDFPRFEGWTLYEWQAHFNEHVAKALRTEGALVYVSPGTFEPDLNVYLNRPELQPLQWDEPAPTTQQARDRFAKHEQDNRVISANREKARQQWMESSGRHDKAISIFVAHLRVTDERDVRELPHLQTLAEIKQWVEAKYAGEARNRQSRHNWLKLYAELTKPRDAPGALNWLTHIRKLRTTWLTCTKCPNAECNNNLESLLLDDLVLRVLDTLPDGDHFAAIRLKLQGGGAEYDTFDRLLSDLEKANRHYQSAQAKPKSSSGTAAAATLSTKLKSDSTRLDEVISKMSAMMAHRGGATRRKQGRIESLLDTGASRIMSPEKAFFRDLVPDSTTIRIANGQEI